MMKKTKTNAMIQEMKKTDYIKKEKNKSAHKKMREKKIAKHIG